VRREGEADVWLSPSEMATVMHGDRVSVRIVRLDRKGRPEGRVLDILERRKRAIIGRLLLEKGIWLVAPEDRRFGQDILVPKNATAGARAGQVVAVELTEPPLLHAQPVGRITEVLGEIDDAGMEIEIAVRKYEVPHQFSPATQAAAEALPDHVRAIDMRRRVDLTDVPLVTIDGEDARDFDDAVYCEPHVQGKGKHARSGWRLLVAIADVSHYVKPGEPLDADAYERATSVYFPRRVIPMLPEKLSNGLCSLNPLVPRLTLVCDMLVSATGDVEAYQFYPAVIQSHARLTYTEVAAALANAHGLEAQRLAPLLPHLRHLHDVYRALLKARGQRGAVDFESTETYIVCDDQGRIQRILPRTRNDAHKLIEEAMLAANTCAADFIAGAEHAGLYRVHEGPTPPKREALQNQLRALGVGLSISDDPTPKEYQAIAHATQERPDAQQIHTLLLRSMQQAIYTPVNSGHFGLAYEAYTHFTSPIRRYPDLLVHRVIKAILAGKPYRLIGGRKAAGAQAEQARWEEVGAHCSANERRADEASRDVTLWLKCQYMREHLGEEYAGTVTAATPFGIFVTLDELYVEGLVHITELGSEYFRFDEARQELRGERTGIRYAIGSRVRVQVMRVDLDARKIDFRLINESGGEHRPGGRPTKAGEQLAQVQAADRALKRQRREAAAEASASPRGGQRKGAAKASHKASGKAPSKTAQKAAHKKTPGRPKFS